MVHLSAVIVYLVLSAIVGYRAETVNRFCWLLCPFGPDVPTSDGHNPVGNEAKRLVKQVIKGL